MPAATFTGRPFRAGMPKSVRRLSRAWVYCSSRSVGGAGEGERWETEDIGASQTAVAVLPGLHGGIGAKGHWHR